MANLRDHNKTQIEKFIVYHNRLFPSSAGSKIDTRSFTGKPESDPPIPDKGLDYLEQEDNKHAFTILEPILTDLSSDPEHFEYWYIFAKAGLRKGSRATIFDDDEQDHGALRRWRSRETDDDKMRADLFEWALSFVERRVHARYPGVKLQVKIPRKEQMVTRMAAARSRMPSYAQGAAYEDRKYDTRASYRVIVRQLEDLEKETGLPREKAKRKLREVRLEAGDQLSIGRINDALAFVKKERASSASGPLDIDDSVRA